MVRRVKKGEMKVKHLKRVMLSCLIVIFSMSLISSIPVKAAEKDVTSEATISFSKKTLKNKDEESKTKETKPKPSVKNKIDDNGKKYYSALPKTGEYSHQSFIYVGLALILSVLTYKVYTKEERR